MKIPLGLKPSFVSARSAKEREVVPALADLCYVKRGDEHWIVATNGVIALAIPAEEVNPEDSPGLLPHEIVAGAEKVGTEEYWPNIVAGEQDVIVELCPAPKETLIVSRLPNLFPPVLDTIARSEDKSTSSPGGPRTVTINIEQLARFSKALGSKILTLQVSGPNMAIIVTAPTTTGMGVLSPIQKRDEVEEEDGAAEEPSEELFENA